MRTGDVGQEHTVSTPFEPSAGLDALFVAFHDEKAYTLRVKDRGVELVTFDFAAKIDTPCVAIPKVRRIVRSMTLSLVGASSTPATIRERLRQSMTTTGCRLGRVSRNRPPWRRRPSPRWCVLDSVPPLTVSVSPFNRGGPMSSPAAIALDHVTK